MFLRKTARTGGSRALPIERTAWPPFLLTKQIYWTWTKYLPPHDYSLTEIVAQIQGKKEKNFVDKNRPSVGQKLWTQLPLTSYFHIRQTKPHLPPYFCIRTERERGEEQQEEKKNSFISSSIQQLREKSNKINRLNLFLSD